jgi:chaperonin GroEL (HSP60 family)
MKQNSKYEEILNLENDRVSKSKDIVNSLLATGANVILIASDEVDQVIENLLVANKVFAVRISIEEIEYLSRYTRATPIRMIDDLKRSDILGKIDHIYEDEDNGVIYIHNGSREYMATMIVSGATKETSLERWGECC